MEGESEIAFARGDKGFREGRWCGWWAVGKCRMPRRTHAMGKGMNLLYALLQAVESTHLYVRVGAGSQVSMKSAMMAMRVLANTKSVDGSPEEKGVSYGASEPAQWRDRRGERHVRPNGISTSTRASSPAARLPHPVVDTARHDPTQIGPDPDPPISLTKLSWRFVYSAVSFMTTPMPISMDSLTGKEGSASSRSRKPGTAARGRGRGSMGT